MPKIVEVSQDALGHLLVYARDFEGNREGEPVCNAAGDPEYYKTRSAAQRATKVIASWGVVHPKLAHHYDALLTALDGIPLWCLGTTKAGHPRHPLYVRGDTPLVPFNH